MAWLTIWLLGGFPFGQWLLFGQNPGWGAATSSVLASTPNVTPDSPHRERVAHTRGIAKAVSGREKWKCFRLIVSHLECIFEAEGTGTKQPVCYVTEMAPPFNKAMIISSFISGL